MDFVYSFRAGGTRSWIGLSRAHKDNPWTWTNGFSLDLVLTIDDERNMKCVTIEKNTGDSHQWKGAICNTEFPWICKQGE